MKNLLLFAVLAVASLGTSRAVWATNYNVSLTDSRTTSDSTVPGGGGSQYTCSDNPQNFFCAEGPFTCFGWTNCSALGATGGAPNLATFLDNNPAEFTAGGPGSAIQTPEPASLILLGLGLGLLWAQRRRVC